MTWSKKILNKIPLLMLIGTFIFLFVFFFKIHPLVFFDSDDWHYIAYNREALPVWKVLNPAKVLPETFMPLMSDIGAYFLYPFTHDYVNSITFMHAIVFSVAICIYLVNAKITIDSLSSGKIKNTVLIAFFLLLHFSLYKTKVIDNDFVFAARDLNCCYNYILPGIWNATLVMFFMRNGCYIKKEGDTVQSSLLLILVYLGIFSNLFQSIILTAYLCSDLFFSLLSEIRKKTFQIRTYCKQKATHFFILALWAGAMIYEANGGRASGAGSIQLIKTWQYFWETYPIKLNKSSVIIVVFCIISAIIMLARLKKRGEKDNFFGDYIIRMLLAGIITGVFIFLLCSKVNPSYITRNDVIFGAVFYFFISGLLSAAYIWGKVKYRITFILPLLLYVFLMNNLMGYRIFRESIVNNVWAKNAISINNYLIEQMVNADETGASQLSLKVPKWDTGDNFPHADYMGSEITVTLYKHGVISRWIDVTIEPDESINQKYNLPY